MARRLREIAQCVAKLRALRTKLHQPTQNGSRTQTVPATTQTHQYANNQVRPVRVHSREAPHHETLLLCPAAAQNEIWCEPTNSASNRAVCHAESAPRTQSRAGEFRIYAFFGRRRSQWRINSYCGTAVRDVFVTRTRERFRRSLIAPCTADLERPVCAERLCKLISITRRSERNKCVQSIR
jgi:hypothetical protein